MRFLPVLLLLFAYPARAFWPFTESEAAREARFLREAEIAKHLTFLEQNRIGRIKSYQYSERELTQDVGAGWQYVLVVDRSINETTGQRLRIYENGNLRNTYLVSTAFEDWQTLPSGSSKAFVTTPTGRFIPLWFKREYRSAKWNAKMPFSVFFIADGTAIHAAGSRKVASRLGRRASAGCIHLSMEDAESVFNLVRENARSTLIIVEDRSH